VNNRKIKFPNQQPKLQKHSVVSVHPVQWHEINIQVQAVLLLSLLGLDQWCEMRAGRDDFWYATILKSKSTLSATNIQRPLASLFPVACPIHFQTNP